MDMTIVKAQSASPTVPLVGTGTIDKQEAINDLARIREEWESFSDGESLLNVEGSIGLLLVDVCKALKLEKREIGQVLGKDLFLESLPYLFSIAYKPD